MKTKEELAEFKTCLKAVWDLQKKYVEKSVIDTVSPYPGINVKMSIDCMVRNGCIDADSYDALSVTITDKGLKKFIVEICPDAVMEWVEEKYNIEYHSKEKLEEIGIKYKVAIEDLARASDYAIEDFDTLIFHYNSFMDAYEDLTDQGKKLSSKFRVERVRISPSYEAEMVTGSKIISVGCQKVNIDDVRKLLKVYEELNAE